MSDIANTTTTQERGMTHEEREREERLKAIQLEALGFRRRDRISTDDYGHTGRLSRFEQERIERAREVNKVGSDAFAKAQENKGMLSGWNNAWKNIAADASTEMLDSLEDGQSHRASLSAKLAGEYDDDPDEFHRDSRGSGRGGRGGGAGRGGGVIGTRGRGSLRPMEASGATGRVESSNDRQPISFVIPKKGGTANTSTAGATRAQQWKENRKSQPPLGLRGKAPGQSPFQHTAGARDQTQRSRAASGTSSRAAAAAPGLRRGKSQARNPSPDYESRLASPEAFLAAGVRIFSQNAAPSPITTAAAGKQPPQAASTSAPKAPSIRSPPTQTPAPVPVVRLPPVAQAKAMGTAQQNPPSEDTTKSRRKSVRFADFSDTATSTVDSSIFGAQVDQAPVGTPDLYAPPVLMNPTPSAEAKGSYLDDLLGLDIEPDIVVGETKDQKARDTEAEKAEATKDRNSREPDSVESQTRHRQEGVKENQSNKEAQMQKELKNTQYILASLRATGLASKEIVAHYEDRASSIKERMGTQAFSAGEEAEATGAKITDTISKELEKTDPNNTSSLRDVTKIRTAQDLSTTSSLRDITSSATATAKTDPNPTSPHRDVTNISAAAAKKAEAISSNSEHLDESDGEHRSSPSERNIKPSSDATPLSQARPEPQTASKPTVHMKAQANISPLGLPPLPVIDLRASLWQNTVVSLPFRRAGIGPDALGQLLGENLIGERVLPGRPDPSQTTRPTASAGTPLSTEVTATAPISSSTPTSAALVSRSTHDRETPTSPASTTVQTLPIPTAVAAALPSTSTTSSSTPTATPDKAEAGTSAAQSTISGHEQQSTKAVTKLAEIAAPTIPTVLPSVETTISSKDYSSTVAQPSSPQDLLVPGQSVRDQGDSNILHGAHPNAQDHQSTTTTSSLLTTTTDRRAGPTSSQAHSVARPIITGRVLPNIPDNAITRQYAGSPSLVSPTASTLAAVHGGTRTSEPTTVTQLEDSLNHFHITRPLQSTQSPQTTAPRQSQPFTANSTLASSIHQSQEKTRLSRRGAAPMVSPFLQSLQNATPLPASGVGSATWLQYNQGSTSAGKDRPTSELTTSSQPPPKTSEAQPSAKDAWGRVRRAGS